MNSRAFLFGAFILCFAGSLAAQDRASLQLPDVLLGNSGTRVESAETWNGQRRAELLELFRENIYGRAPVGRPETLAFVVEDTTPGMMGGKADRKLVRINYSGHGGQGSIHLVLFTPTGKQAPVPCFLLICNRGKELIDPSRQNQSEFWPAEEIIGRGYAAAAFLNTDVAPDAKDSWQHGVHKIFGPNPRTSDAWGTIGAWAWGASRVMDYLVTDPAIDPKRVALVGHSRGGKTALWAAAQDERFAMAVSNESGSTGAALARGKTGERVKDINRGFPYWFCDNYKKFNDRETELPVDQHMLIGLIAPRLVYVASASEDAWADPKSEFAAAVHAAPVYKLHGLKGLSSDKFPQPQQPIHGGHIGYHLRTGKHNLTAYDWRQFMDFAAGHGWKSASKLVE